MCYQRSKNSCTKSINLISIFNSFIYNNKIFIYTHNVKILSFSVSFNLLDPDPYSEYGSKRPLNTDSDPPKHCGAKQSISPSPHFLTFFLSVRLPLAARTK